mgnify:CR=1 FL=1|tara:strand:+ start:972 stop:1382 length:411 start_codon:yes stop_codon:yes gene_type:complete
MSYRDVPFYETCGPDIEEVRRDIMHASNVMKWLKKFPTENISTVSEIGDCEIIKAGGKTLCYGSFRGYATFVRKDILNNIVSELTSRENAIKKLSNYTILSIWMNNILYRPPTKNNATGLRYDNIKKTFEQHQIDK